MYWRLEIVKLGKFKKDNKPCGENVKQRINEALEFAESNPISNVLIVMISENGEVFDAWANQSDPFVAVGAMESLKKDFMDRCIEGRG